MKKALSALLAILMVIPMLAFPSVAEEATVEPEQTGTEFVPVSTAADLASTTHPLQPTWPAALVDNNGYWDGDGKPVYAGDNNTAVMQTVQGGTTGVALYKIRYLLNSGKSYDISNMQTLCFDLYLSDAYALSGIKFELELRPSYMCNDNLEMMRSGTLAALHGGTLTDGWNHFEIDLSSFSKTDKNPDDDYTLDMTNWNYFRIFNSASETIGDQGEEITLMIKDVYFSSVRISEPETYKTGDDFYFLSGMASGKPSKTASAGTFTFSTGTRPTAMDITVFDALELDVWFENEALNDLNFYFELTSSGKADVNEDGLKATMATLYGERLEAGKWYTIHVPFSKFSSGNCVRTAWNYFRIFSDGGVDGSPYKGGYAVETAYTVKVRAPRFVCYDDVRMIWDAESETSAVKLQQSSGSTIPEYIYSIGDLDGDDDNELILVDRVLDEGVASEFVGKGGGYADASKKGVKGRVDFVTPLPAHSNFKGVIFDIYVSSGAAGNTADALTSSILDLGFHFELSSSTTQDWEEIQWVGSLKNIFGNQLVMDQWCTVALEIDNGSAASSASYDSDGDGKNDSVRGTYDKLKGTRYLRIYNQNDFYFADHLTFAIDNIRAYCDTSEAETALGATEVFTLDGAAGVSWVAGKHEFPSKTYAARIKKLLPGNTYPVARDQHATFAATDISKMDVVCFDLYLDLRDTDANTPFINNLLNVNKFEFELASGGRKDANELTWRAPLNQILNAPINYTGPGWYSVEVALDSYIEKTAVDLTAVDCLSMYIIPSITTDGNDYAYIAVDNIYFKKNVVSKVSGAQLSLSDAFDMLYSVKTNDLIMTTPVVDVRFSGETTRFIPSLDEDGLNYSFAFNEIFAHRMSDVIETTVWNLDNTGKLLSSTHTYSVKDYAANWLNKTVEEYTASGFDTEEKVSALKRLLSDALYYGAAAQTYASYNMETLASDVTGVVPNANTGNNFVKPSSDLKVLSRNYDETKDAYQWRGATLVLDSAMTIRYSFRASNGVDGLAVSCSDGETYSSFGVASDSVGTYYFFDVPVFAYEFDKTFAVSFDGAFDGEDAYVLNYSVDHYVATYHGRAGEKIDALVEAIYNYGVAADAYCDAMGVAEH